MQLEAERFKVRHL